MSGLHRDPATTPTETVAPRPRESSRIRQTRFVTEAERAQPRFEPDQHQFFIPYWKAGVGPAPGA